MNIGALRHLITIRQPAVPGDIIRGQADQPAVTIADKTPASIEPLDGRELFEAQQMSANISHRIRLRYRAGVKPTQQVLFGARVFEISSVINVEERNIELRLLCQELAS